MKIRLQLTLCLLCVLLLSSCAMKTPKATEVVASLATPSQAPSTSPVPSEVPSPMATPTENPLAGAPEGATGKAANGNWTKTENGVTYTWTVLKDRKDKLHFSGWFASHVKNGSLNGDIPLIDQPADGFTKTIPFSMDFLEGVKGPYLQHPDNPASSDAPNFTRTLLSRLMERYYGKSILRMSADEVRSFYRNLFQGSISIPFSTPAGSYEWKPDPSIGVKFYAVGWYDADPAKNPEFNETMDEMEGKSLTYRWTVFTDTDGILMIVAAVKDPQLLSDNQLFGWILHPMELVIKEQQISANVRGWGFPTYPSELVSSINRGSAPEFSILRASK